MRRISLFFMLSAFVITAKAQETVVNLSLQPNYDQEVFFKFSTGQSENYDVDLWDIAFLRTGSFDFGERINDGLGIEVYEVSTDPTDWDNISPEDLTENTPQYYNSDIAWEIGAFDQGGDPNDQFSFGWGEYDPSDHHLYGKSIFILKYPDGSFKKFMIEEFFGGYTIKYANWNDANETWGNTKTENISNQDNPNNIFNYYSLTNQSLVTASPDAEDWDLVFQTYTTDLGIMYPVLGALQNPNVKVASSTDMNAQEEDLTFSEEINTVGYDWKEFDGSAYQIDSDKYYFLKYDDGSVYRFHFLSFDGSSTGNFSLGYEDVTNQMEVTQFDKNNSFSIYPNPTTDRNINLLYENNNDKNAIVEIYDLNGRKVKSIPLAAHNFSNHSINLENLSAGVYLLKFQSGKFYSTKKLILK